LPLLLPPLHEQSLVVDPRLWSICIMDHTLISPQISSQNDWISAADINMSYVSLYDIMTHSHFDTWHHNKISKACRANNMTRDSKNVNLTHSLSKTFDLQPFFTKHISFTWQPSEESLRVLFFTHSLAVDLVH
jgi:hypothetical protein